MFSSHLTSKEMIVVTLNVNSKEYWQQEVKEQIKLLSSRIREICSLLSKKNRKATWFIAWQEYGIKEKSTRALPAEITVLFKKEFKKISELYPNLVIIAGTTLTKKIINKSKLPKIFDFYKPLEWIEKIDDSYLEQPIAFEKNHFEEAKQSSSEKVTVIANKARIYHNGEERRHGKITPYFEDSDLSFLYQPGKGNNLSPIVKIKDLDIGIEVCREHLMKYSVLKKYVKESKSTPPLLHFIISSSIALHLNPICAKAYAIHVDSMDRNPPIIARGHKKNEASLLFYRCDVMQPIVELPEVITPVYPLQYKILDLLEEAIASEGPENADILKTVADQVMTTFGAFVLKDSEYEGLKKLLTIVSSVSYELYEQLNDLFDKSNVSSLRI